MTTINDQVEKVSVNGAEYTPVYDTAGGTDRKVSLDTIKTYTQSNTDTDAISEGAVNKYDKTVTITGGTDIEVTGTYPNFTVNRELNSGYADGYINGGVASNRYDASATETESGFSVDNLFDGDSTTYWGTYPSTTLPQTIKLNLYVSVLKTSYYITARVLESAAAPKVWTIEGSNDNSNWTVIDTQSNQVFADGERKDYSFSNTTKYTDYRMVITEIGTVGDYPTFAEFGIFNYNTDLNITALKARSDDDTQDIEKGAGSLDITIASDWASGVVPALTSTSIYAWADYNSGTPRFIFDDATGSNIAGAKRRVGTFTTDSSGNVNTIYAVELPDGSIYHTAPQTSLGAVATGWNTKTLPIPSGVLAKATCHVIYYKDNTSITANVRSAIMLEKRVGWTGSSGDVSSGINEFEVWTNTGDFEAYASSSGHTMYYHSFIEYR